MSGKSVFSALAMAFALALLVNVAFPWGGVFADEPTAKTQVAYVGGISYYTHDGVLQEGIAEPNEHTWVQVSKTVTDATAPQSSGLEENEFEITLEVKTKEEHIRDYSVEDAAIVIVFDTSTSMTDYCAECGNNVADGSGNPVPNKHKTGCSQYGTSSTGNASNRYTFDSRFNRARIALRAFIEAYSESAETTNAERLISFVTFSQTAEHRKIRDLDWVDINTNNTNYNENNTALTDIISDLRTSPYTNTDCGLILARNLFRTGSGGAFNSHSGIANRNVILFTDGGPTSYYNDGSAAGNTLGLNSLAGTQNYASGYGGSYAAYNESNQPPRYGYPQTIAAQIKGTSYGAKIFTVAYAGDSGAGDTSGATDWNTNKNWLKASIASSPSLAYEASGTASLDEIAALFKAIQSNLTVGIKPFTITDPMGDCIVWDSGNQWDENIGQTFDPAGKEFKWELTKASDPGATDGWRTYSYSYKVTLDTLAITADDAGKAFYTNAIPAGVPTNDRTTFTFVRTTENSTYATADFRIPKVFGYTGGFTFTKTDQADKPLAGATFKIESIDKGYAPPEGVVSNGSGLVSFTSIPSGHAYKLTETHAPDGYKTDGTSYLFKVSYGVIIPVEPETGSEAKAKALPGGDARSISNESAIASIDKQVRKAGSGSAWADSVTIAAGEDVEFLITVKNNRSDSVITAAALTLTDKFLDVVPLNGIGLPKIATQAGINAIDILLTNGEYNVHYNPYPSGAFITSGSAIGWDRTLLANSSTSSDATFTNTAELFLYGDSEGVSTADVVVPKASSVDGGGGTYIPPVEDEEEDKEGVTTGDDDDDDDDSDSDDDTTIPNYPFPTYPGQTIIPQDDGTYLVLDENGVPLGTWSYDPDLDEWIFDEATPLADLPQTGAVLPQDAYAGWLGLLAELSLLGLAIAALRRRAEG
jgi:hypothetical protein